MSDPIGRTPKLFRSVAPRRLAAGLLALAGILLAWVPPAAGQGLSLPPAYVRRQLTPSGEPASSLGFFWRVDRRGEWVAFVGDVETAGLEAVYALRRNGGALHRLSPYAPLGSVDRLELTADGRGVVYSGDLETEGLREVWSAPFSGTPAAAVKLNLAVVGGGVSYFMVGATSGRVLYLAETAAGKGLWSVPAAGPAAAGVELDPTLATADVATAAFLIGSPERMILFYYDASQSTMRIWSAPSAGPAAAGSHLLEASPAGCTSSPAGVSLSTQRLAFVHTCPTSAGARDNQLWSVPLAGPAAAAISLGGGFVEGGGIRTLSASADGGHLVFRADKATLDKDELWSVPFVGPAGALVRLSLTGSAATDTQEFAISPDGTRVAYVADPVVNERFSAFSVPIEGPSTLSVPLVTADLAGRDVTSVKFTPDGENVVFRADLDVDNRFDLYVVPADGSAAEEQLTNDGAFPSGLSVSLSYALHPDGKRVVFVYDENTPSDSRGLGEQKLFGSYVQDARLNQSPVAGGTVQAFAIFPDSAGTIYLSDQDVDGIRRLYVADSRLFGDGFEEGTTAAWSDLP